MELPINQIDGKELTQDDIGRWVEYWPTKGGKDKGRIKSWNELFVFVVYACDNNWDEYQNYTAAATRPKDLTFIAEARPRSFI